jgi:predicted PurR-regulated permease PerM
VLNLSRVDWNRVLVVELAVLVGLVLLYIAAQAVERVGHFLLLAAASIIVAFLVAPAVNRLEQAIGNRVLATGIVYLGVLATVGVALTLIAGPLIREAAAFAREMPRYLDRVPDWAHGLEAMAANFGLQLQFTELTREATTQLQAAGAIVLSGTLGIAAGVTSALADVLLTLVLSFYLSVDGPRLREQLHARVPTEHQPRLLRVEDSLRRVFGGYVRGQLILGVTIGIMAGVGATLFGLPYPVVLAVLAAVFELVPMFGSLLGAVPSLIAALFQPFPTVLWVALFFIGINQVETYLLAPRITGESLGLRPLWALAALLIGVELAGFLGALVAVPVAALLVDLAKPTTAEIATSQPPVEGEIQAVAKPPPTP